MKSELDTGKSRNGRINQARKYNRALSALLDQFEGTQARQPHTDGAYWGAVREMAEKLLKAVHEANAYNNVMVGDTADEDSPLYVTRLKNGESQDAA